MLNNRVTQQKNCIDMNIKRHDFHFSNRHGTKLVPRVFLRHTLITKPNEHPGTSIKCAQNLDALAAIMDFFDGNANQRKMAVALALILQAMN